jgi:hypothetical protein
MLLRNFATGEWGTGYMELNKTTIELLDSRADATLQLTSLVMIRVMNIEWDCTCLAFGLCCLIEVFIWFILLYRLRI